MNFKSDIRRILCVVNLRARLNTMPSEILGVDTSVDAPRPVSRQKKTMFTFCRQYKCDDTAHGRDENLENNFRYHRAPRAEDDPLKIEEEREDRRRFARVLDGSLSMKRIGVRHIRCFAPSGCCWMVFCCSSMIWACSSIFLLFSSSFLSCSSFIILL